MQSPKRRLLWERKRGEDTHFLDYAVGSALHDKKRLRIRPASIKIPFMWEPIFNTITRGWPNEA